MFRHFLLVAALLSGPVAALDWNLSVGPHFYYTRLYFNNPSHLEGYQVGVTAELGTQWCRYFGSVEFEGSWDAGPITGDPCQKSDLAEYFVELKVGTWGWSSLRPYAGFGWDRYQNEQDPNAARLRYRYDKLFIPLGFFYDGQLCSWEYSLQFEWRPDVYRRLELVGVRLDPDWGHAFRVQALFTQRCFYRDISLKLVPFFDWNRFGKTSVTNSAGATLVIPRLLRWNLGMRLLFGYTF